MVRRKTVLVRHALCLLLIGTLGVAASAHSLERVRVQSASARSLAEHLQRSGYDVLEGSVTNGSLELVVSTAERDRLETLGFSLTTIDIGRPFREIQAERGADGEPPVGYPDLAEITTTMMAAADSFPSICRLVDLTATLGVPATFEGRHLFAIEISDNVTQDEDEPAMLLVGAHHCRELVTPVIALHAIVQLTSQYGLDPAITDLVDDHEIWIAPVWNPDGYEFVFDSDHLWRKNRRVFAKGIGVDLNRNYPHGWDTACSGSEDPTSLIYKGPSPASEAETQTMLALTEHVRFAKVVDYHSSGREVLHGYACWTHPFDPYLEQAAIDLATAAGYDGAHRPPSADGEHFEWQLGTQAALAFLMETSTEFQPPFEDAEAEGALVWPGTVWLAERPIPLWGHVSDANTALGLEATIELLNVKFENGETNASHPETGRYHVFLPSGTYDVRFAAEGYHAATIPSVWVDENAGTELDVALVPAATSVAASPGPSGSRIVFVDPLRRVLLYELERPARVRLRVFDVRGRLVATLVDGPVEAGRHREVWSGRGDRPAGSGVYLYRMDVGRDVHRGKLIHVR